MNKTEPIALDLGWLGTIEVDAIVRFVPGERGSREHGRQMEPDYPDQYLVVEIEHPILSCEANHWWLTRMYHNDEDFRDCVDYKLDKLIEAQREEAA